VSKQNRQDGGAVDRHNLAEVEDYLLDLSVDGLLERLGEQITAAVVTRTACSP
jgi:S-adenosylmethionine:diacylglycerol 3-amino-3-carboxypropyl transferase